MTPFQLALLAQAPCTRTIVGLVWVGCAGAACEWPGSERQDRREGDQCRQDGEQPGWAVTSEGT